MLISYDYYNNYKKCNTNIYILIIIIENIFIYLCVLHSECRKYIYFYIHEL